MLWIFFFFYREFCKLPDIEEKPNLGFCAFSSFCFQAGSEIAMWSGTGWGVNHNKWDAGGKGSGVLDRSCFHMQQTNRGAQTLGLKEVLSWNTFIFISIHHFYSSISDIGGRFTLGKCISKSNKTQTLRPSLCKTLEIICNSCFL